MKEDYEPQQSSRDEQKRVPAQPQEIQSHLFSKVVP